MNLIINIIFLLIVLIYGKKFARTFSDNIIYNNLILIGIISIANIAYRVIINLYFKKPAVIKDIITYSMIRSLLVLSGIIIFNYIVTNPNTLKKLGITFDFSTISGDLPVALVSLIPYFLVKVGSCLFYYDV